MFLMLMMGILSAWSRSSLLVSICLSSSGVVRLEIRLPLYAEIGMLQFQTLLVTYLEAKLAHDMEAVLTLVLNENMLFFACSISLQTIIIVI